MRQFYAAAVRFTRTQLDSYRDATVPDLLGERTQLLFVGINPGLWTAAVQAHFARRGNRFYPALYRAGIVDKVIDAAAGYSVEDRTLLLAAGVGITNLAPRATARADELTAAELEAGGRRLAELVDRTAPAVVAVLGITAYRIAFRRPRATVGQQAGRLAGSQLWVVPNPSGLNAHSSLDDLARAYREAAVTAGLVPPSEH